jgi:methylglutaconyl-CoA hydratase
MSDFERIRYDVEGALTTVLLNRPEKRNAIDDQTVDELGEAFATADADEQVRVVLLKGAGKDFCAGADLSQLERIAAEADPIANLSHAAALGDLFILMRSIGKPIVAAVQGNVFAGGAGLATACDIVIAGESARISYPEVRLGFVPAMVLALLRRVVGEKVAFELAALGEPIPAQEARRLGIINRVVPDDELDIRADAFARELATRSASALQLIKRMLYGVDGMTFEQAIQRGAEINVLARSTPDLREGVARFLAGRRSP